MSNEAITPEQAIDLSTREDRTVTISDASDDTHATLLVLCDDSDDATDADGRVCGTVYYGDGWTVQAE